MSANFEAAIIQKRLKGAGANGDHRLLRKISQQIIVSAFFWQLTSNVFQSHLHRSSASPPLSFHEQDVAFDVVARKNGCNEVATGECCGVSLLFEYSSFTVSKKPSVSTHRPLHLLLFCSLLHHTHVVSFFVFVDQSRASPSSTNDPDEVSK